MVKDVQAGLREYISTIKQMLLDLQAFLEILEALQRGEQIDLQHAMPCFMSVWKVGGRLGRVLKHYPFRDLIQVRIREKKS